MEEYAEDLRLALDALTSPEKLQINTLTDVVRENPQYAEQSVKAIKQRILTVGCLVSLCSSQVFDPPPPGPHLAFE
jgi:hypothetical protein